VVYEQIGLGGMATVHRAETQGIGGFSKQIALKRMLPSVAADATLVQSFIREARLASHLRHANVAQTYDLGKVGDVYFIAMELVPGRNLREILKHCASVAGNMPLPIAMNIVNQICDALDYAHNLCDELGRPLGIIHRDVSPSNVIVSEGGVVKLIDFGIAKATGAGMSTQSGTIKGKFSYMAPEYLRGNIDARADLFALGVIAYELLTNRPLFQGNDDMDTLFRVKDMKVQPPSKKNPQVPEEIDTIIMTALERDPDQRWQRATALRNALTTETRRLGLIAHNNEVLEWIDWAFRQGGKRDEESVVISIDRISTETPLSRLVPDEFLAANDSLATLVRPAGSQPMQTQTQPQDWKSPSNAQTNPRSDFEVPTKADRPSVQMQAEQPPGEWANESVTTLPGSPPQWNVSTTPDGPSIRSVDWDMPSAHATKEVVPHIPAAAKRSTPHVVQRSGSGPNRSAGSAPTPVQRRPSQPNLTGDEPTRQTPPVRNTPASSILSEVPPRPSQPFKTLTGPAVSMGPLSGARTSPQQIPLGPVSGARTTPHIPGKEIAVSNSAVLDEREVSTKQQSYDLRTRVAEGKSGGAGNFLLALLVLIAAGGAAAVVYFALPYLT